MVDHTSSFHYTIITLYGTIVDLRPSSYSYHCSWFLCLCPLLYSMTIIQGIHYKVDTNSLLQRLEREKEDGMFPMKCITELKKKEVELYLLKEVDVLKRVKGLWVVMAKGSTMWKWSIRDFTTMIFIIMLYGFWSHIVYAM